METERDRRHPQMPRIQRAKQFMPFAAVRGLDRALAEKERELLREEKKTLSEESAGELDRLLRETPHGALVRAVAYAEREMRYLTYTGSYGVADPVRRTITVGESEIPIGAIVEFQPQDQKGE